VVGGRHAQVQMGVPVRARQAGGCRTHPGIVLDLVGERARGGVAVVSGSTASTGPGGSGRLLT
jgi:hypothetical protein